MHVRKSFNTVFVMSFHTCLYLSICNGISKSRLVFSSVPLLYKTVAKPRPISINFGIFKVCNLRHRNRMKNKIPYSVFFPLVSYKFVYHSDMSLHLSCYLSLYFMGKALSSYWHIGFFHGVFQVLCILLGIFTHKQQN